MNIKLHKTLLLAFLALLLLVLAACSPAVAPAAPTQPAEETPAPTEEVPPTGNPFSGLDPHDVLIQMDFEPTFSLPQFSYVFGRVPSFTLLADGTLVYTDEHNNMQVMQAQLSPEAVAALVQQVWDLGYAQIESHTDMCLDRGGGNQECIADASYTILRVRQESGELRETRHYANFSNNPEVFQMITDMLMNYAHPDAEPYQPEAATLFIQPETETYGETPVEWPLDAAYLTNPPAAPLGFWAVALEGDEIDQYLAAAGSLDRRFFEHEGKFYSASLVPWLPGADYSAEIEAEFPQQ